MPVFAYVGVPGSGKSYLMVKQVILPAVLEGRRVVSNINGLNESAIHDYLVKEKKVDRESLGAVVKVSNDELAKPDFFPYEKLEGESFIKGGELVVIDEAQMYWGYGDKLLKTHLEFVTQHRHYVDPVSKRACDIVLGTQVIKYLNPKVLGVVDQTFALERKNEIGLNSTFFYSIYRGGSVAKANRISVLPPQTYDKAIFGLYDSFKGGVGVVENVDKSSNVMNSPKLKFALVGIVALGLFAFWGLSGIFGKKDKGKEAATSTSSAVGVASGGVGKAGVDRPSAEKAHPGESDWKVIGHYEFADSHFVLIRRGETVRTLLNPKGFYFDALRASGSLDGETLASYTGEERRGRGGVPSFMGAR